ncbi:DEAD/DEAH box helicase family protein [Membranihabitans maritimus]|uniref:DEAD/DEAH box helicase family protein n=1 Tax=Membranihabitans maritimus TaxID=2904244 RepID=UPI001F19595E|nr:DEAD/DEAH box helicase family protein [Membranihabitans maritimus]
MKLNQAKLNQALLLNRYMLYLFGVNEFEGLATHLTDSRNEGWTEDHISYFHRILVTRLYSNTHLTESLLLEYDQNIFSHTDHINGKRDEPISWKYFQYLSLLFTEIYLDRYFSNKYQLLKDINAFVDRFNDPLDREIPNNQDLIFPHFKLEELNKLAFWNATGSGKTLLMHVNIRQLLYYTKKYNYIPFENILLVTPNEGLSRQHLKEFGTSNIEAELFNKSGGGLFSRQVVKIIDIHKLNDESGDKTIAVEAFETNNCVLIDEGHRGISGDHWKRRRDYLSQTGFAIEYSATFGQAVSTSKKSEKAVLNEEYGKSILFDYSYKYFYHDGYGKDYRILNLPTDEDQIVLHKYLIGSLLSFYQQKVIHKDHPTEAKNVFLIHNPLWVFVGGTVTSGYSKRNASDILQILHFFQRFVENENESVEIIHSILDATDGLVDAGNRSIFRNFFTYITSSGLNAQEVYQDILIKLFNTSFSGGNLFVDKLKGQDGEMGIRVGNGEYFGLINVGDSSKLFKLTQEEDILGVEKEFSSSLFQKVNDEESHINVLIGAKKFTEGWSSWRVSTMGLMNIGRSQGSEIIQLFGRGVRLKGYDFKLKRSTALLSHERPENGIPTYIKPLETLNVFGIRADYMEQFKDILEEEGLPNGEKEYVTIHLPTMLTVELDKAKLKIFRVKENVDFKKLKVIDLLPDSLPEGMRIKLDWYPKVQTYIAVSSRVSDIEVHYSGKLNSNHLKHFNWFEVYEEIIKFKNERSWYNLSISFETIQQILANNQWYELYIPEDELAMDSYQKVIRWQEIGIALLKLYIDKYFNIEKQKFLQDFIEVIELTPGDPNFFEEYKIEIEQSMESIQNQLLGIKQLVEKQEFKGDVEVSQGLNVFEFANHLYMPLVSINEKKYRDLVKISPVALNTGEKRFMEDLKAYYESNKEFFEHHNLYLLRNTSRKGIGFFEANGFYPDFIMWLVSNEEQYIGFIDPKGLRNINGIEHPKIQFYKTIKSTIEPRIHAKDDRMYLSSFIVSVTSFEQLKHWRGGDTIGEFNEKNVYFMDNQRSTYIERILEKMLKK